MQASGSLLDKYLELPGYQDARNYEALFQLTTARVVELLDGDMAHLMNSLYRIDVDEQKVKAAFELVTQQQIAEAIAKLILDRIQEKVAFRKRFSQK
jgi:hypothetical protein